MGVRENAQAGPDPVAIPPLPKGAKMVPDEQNPPLPPGAKMLEDLPSIDSTEKPKEQESKWHSAYRWLFGIGDEYKDKGLVTHDLPEYAKKISKQREDYRSSKEFYDAVQKKYQEQVAVDSQEKDPYRREFLLKLAKEERDAQLSPINAEIEQFAPRALGTASKVLGGSMTKENVGLGAVAAKFPATRLPIGAFYAVEGGEQLFKPQPNENTADWLERMLLGLSGVGAGTTVMASHRLPAVTDEYRTKKLTYATGGADPASIREVLPDLIDQVRKQGKPRRKGQSFGGQSVNDVKKYVDTSLAEKEAKFNTELQAIGDLKQVPGSVAAEIRSLIKPNMENTASGQADIEYINERAAEFEKPWSLRALNAERMQARDRQGGAPYQKTEARMKRSPNIDLEIDKAIEGSTRDMVYDELGRQKAERMMQQGYRPDQVEAARNEFRELKRKQSALLDIKAKLDDHIKKITSDTYQKKGKPFTAGQTATISAHPGGVTPRVHGLGRFFGREPLSAASKASRQAFKRIPPGKTKPGLPPITGKGGSEEPPPPKKGGPNEKPPITIIPEEKGVSGGPPPKYTGEERRTKPRLSSRIDEFRKELKTEKDPEKIAELKASIDREIAIEKGEPSKPIPHKNLPSMEELEKGNRERPPLGEYNRETKKVEPQKGSKKAPNPDSLKPWLDKATEEWKAANPGKKIDFKAIEKRAKEMKATEGKKSLPSQGQLGLPRL